MKNMFFGFVFAIAILPSCSSDTTESEPEPVNPIPDENVVTSIGLTTKSGIIPVSITSTSKIIFKDNDMIIITDGKEIRYPISEMTSFSYKNIK